MNEKSHVHVQKFEYKGNINLIPDIKNVRSNKLLNNLWLDDNDKSLFDELIMSL